MTFEEEFNQIYDLLETLHRRHYQQLDKQKVKDAWDKVKIHLCNNPNCEICNLIKEFEKEVFGDEK